MILRRVLASDIDMEIAVCWRNDSKQAGPGHVARILIADDDEAVRANVRALLGRNPDLEVCGEAAQAQETVDKTQDLKPDLVILDISLPDLGGLTAGHMIKQSSPATRILIFSIHEDKRWIQTAMLIGAAGYVTKGEAGSVLLKAVETVLQDKIFFPAVG
jgi:DNA-binding NarL/FixJ family response regulator